MWLRRAVRAPLPCFLCPNSHAASVCDSTRCLLRPDFFIATRRKEPAGSTVGTTLPARLATICRAGAQSPSQFPDRIRANKAPPNQEEYRPLGPEIRAHATFRAVQPRRTLDAPGRTSHFASATQQEGRKTVPKNQRSSTKSRLIFAESRLSVSDHVSAFDFRIQPGPDQKVPI